MSLILCPECGNEVSTQAESCPRCGHPFAPKIAVTPPVVPEPVIIARKPVQKSFPNWVFIPVIIILAVVALFMFLMMRENSDANANRTQVNLRVGESDAVTARQTRTITNSEVQTGTSQTVTTAPGAITSVPSTTTTDSTTTVRVPDSTVSSLPQSSFPTTGTTTTNPPSDKGNLEIKATVVGKTGSTQPVRQEKFYLLDRSPEEILSRANIESDGGDLASTCAAAVIDPARRETREKCLAAIRPHIVYSVTTDASGKGSFKNVKPDSYYVFGVTKVGTDSFAIWNTTVTINPGENALLNLNGSGAPTSTTGLAGTGY